MADELVRTCARTCRLLPSPQAVFPSRILSKFGGGGGGSCYGSDMSNLPDYGLFREIKAAAAREAARAER